MYVNKRIGTREEKTKKTEARRSRSPYHGEANKGAWWMPRRQEPKKGAVHCEKPR
jgi:hypothetical protein